MKIDEIIDYLDSVDETIDLAGFNIEAQLTRKEFELIQGYNYLSDNDTYKKVTIEIRG